MFPITEQVPNICVYVIY